MTLDNDLEQVSRERNLREKAEQALHEGRITVAEYDFLLRKELGGRLTSKEHVARAYAQRRTHTEHRRRTLTKVAAVLGLLGVAFLCLGLFLGGTSPVGLVTLETATQAPGPFGPASDCDVSLAANGTNSTGCASQVPSPFGMQP